MIVVGLVTAISVTVAPAVRAVRDAAGHARRVARLNPACPQLPELRTQCGSIRVPLDRANPRRGSTTVAYALVRHRGAGPAEGTVAFNPGGPGIAPIVGLAEQPELFVGTFSRLLDTHDMLLIDPRGAGRSAPVACRGLSLDRVPPTRSGLLDAARSCGLELGQRARYYTSAAIADDIDDVRHELRISQLDLLGESYGTYLMTIYAQRHPTHVRSIVLSGAYPLGFDMWARPNARAMRRAISLLCERSDGACDGSRLLADLGELARKLRARPAAYRSDGARRVLDDTALAAITFGVSGDRNAMGRLPGAVRAALAGDNGPLVEVTKFLQPPLSGQSGAGAGIRLAGQADGVGPFQSLAVTASVICNDYPTLWNRRDTIAERARDYNSRRRKLDASTFAPFSPRAWLNGIFDRGDFCLRWPHREGPSQPIAGRRPDVPVLVFSGELDTNTPTEEGRATARQFPTARLIEVPNTGHVAEFHKAASRCVMALQSEFFRTQTIASTSCLTRIPPIQVKR